MSADVLAVMETAGHRIRNSEPLCKGLQKEICHSVADGLAEARAAVAELIEAAKGMRSVTGGGSVCTVTESLAAYRRMDAALARVGGAK